MPPMVKAEEPPMLVVPFEYTSPWMTTAVDPWRVSELPGLLPQPPWLSVNSAGVEFWLPTTERAMVEIWMVLPCPSSCLIESGIWCAAWAVKSVPENWLLVMVRVTLKLGSPGKV